MHGGDERQLVEDLVPADIAGMQDHVDARERLVHLGAKLAMRIGNEPDDDHRAGAHESSSDGSPQRRATAFGTPT